MRYWPHFPCLDGSHEVNGLQQTRLVIPWRVEQVGVTDSTPALSTSIQIRTQRGRAAQIEMVERPR